MYVDRYVFCVLAKCGYAVSRATAPRHTPSLGGREQFVPSHADDSESHHPSSRAQPCCAHCGTHPVPGRAAVGGKRVGSCVRTGAISSQPEKPIPHFVPGQRGANPGVPTTVFFFFFSFPLAQISHIASRVGACFHMHGPSVRRSASPVATVLVLVWLCTSSRQSPGSSGVRLAGCHSCPCLALHTIDMYASASDGLVPSNQRQPASQK